MSSPVSLGKSPLFLLSLLHLYKKGQTVGLPKVTFGLPNLSSPNVLLFLHVLQNSYKLQLWLILHEEGPAWLSRNFFQAAASLAMPSKAQGSKNWIFISNFSAWFLMASTLDVLNRSWSSRSCTLTARWATWLLKIRSSRALISCTLASSSWNLFYNSSTKALWFGKASSLSSASIWHRL